MKHTKREIISRVFYVIMVLVLGLFLIYRSIQVGELRRIISEDNEIINMQDAVIDKLVNDLNYCLRNTVL